MVATRRPPKPKPKKEGNNPTPAEGELGSIPEKPTEDS